MPLAFPTIAHQSPSAGFGLLDAGVIHSSALNGRYTSEHTNMEIQQRPWCFAASTILPGMRRIHSQQLRLDLLKVVQRGHRLLLPKVERRVGPIKRAGSKPRCSGQ